MQKTSQTGIDLIKGFEGKRLKAYRDAVGVWTIGYGHTRTARAGQVISDSQAEQLLRADLADFESCVARSISVTLNQSQFDALVSFAYNVGCGALRRSTLLRLLNRGGYGAAADQFLRWNRAGGVVLRGLTRRRKAERELFLSGGRSA